MRRLVALLIAVSLTPLARAEAPPPSTRPEATRGAPALTVELPRQVRPGEVVTLRARRGDARDPGLLASGSRDMVEVARKLGLTHVVADLWDGREIELGTALGESGWSADVEVPGGLPPGAYRISVTALDGGGRVHRETVTLRVGGRPLAMRRPDRGDRGPGRSHPGRLRSSDAGPHRWDRQEVAPCPDFASALSGPRSGASASPRCS